LLAHYSSDLRAAERPRSAASSVSGELPRRGGVGWIAWWAASMIEPH